MMKFNFSYKKSLFGLFIFILLGSSFINLYDNRKRFIGITSKFLNPIDSNKNHKWAKEILNGGYILFFRHAERDKWIDVKMYDAMESDLHNNGVNKSRMAENEYFSRAVCLNERGKIQARAMSEIVKHSKLPIGYIESSPSCRSRETANLAFGGYEKLNRNLVHIGPYYEDLNERTNYLRKYLLNIPIKKGTNTIISAHNSVIVKELFDNYATAETIDKYNDKLSLEEGGFYVISRKNGKLHLVHEFHNFNKFSLNFFEREY